MFYKEFTEALKVLKSKVPGYEKIEFQLPFPHIVVIELNQVSSGRLMNRLSTMVDVQLFNHFGWASQNGYLIITENLV